MIAASLQLTFAILASGPGTAPGGPVESGPPAPRSTPLAQSPLAAPAGPARGPSIALPAPAADKGTDPTAVVLGILLLAGCAATAAYVKRRRGPTEEKDPIRVIATQALGGKTRLVLVAVAGRELLLSSSDRGAQLIADWWPEGGESENASVERISEDGSPDEHALPPRRLRAPERQVESLVARPAPRAQSHAVSGILRLKKAPEPRALERSKTLEAAFNDADDDWAQSLLAEMDKPMPASPRRSLSR